MRSPSKANVSTHPARGASFGMCPAARVPLAVNSGADQTTCRYISRDGWRAMRSRTLSIPARLTLRAMNAGDSVSTARRTLSSLRVSASSSFCVRSSLAFIRSPHPNEIDRAYKMELYSILWRAVEAGPRIRFSNRRGQKPLFIMRERANGLSNRERRTDTSWSRYSDGRLDAPVLDPRCQIERAETRWRTDQADAARREADRLPRRNHWSRRRDGSALSAPLRVVVPRPQRAGRAPLHLSRLEVRHGGQLP